MTDEQKAIYSEALDTLKPLLDDIFENHSGCSWWELPWDTEYSYSCDMGYAQAFLDDLYLALHDNRKE